MLPEPGAGAAANAAPPAGMDLSRFSGSDLDRGASRGKEACWRLLHSWLFEFSALPVSGVRCWLLRRFGARVGRGVVIKPRAKITFPWRLSLGDHVWLGEEAWVLNLAPVTVGSHVCISQRAFLCTGSHDWSDPGFRLMCKPIVIDDGAWVCANAFIGPGVTIGRNAVITAGSVVTRDMPANMVCSGNPCQPVRPRHSRPPGDRFPDS